MGQGIAGTSFSPESLNYLRRQTGPSPSCLIDELTSHTTHDMIAIALKAMGRGAHRRAGGLNKREGSLDEDDVAILSIVSAIAASSIEQARLYEEAKLAEVMRLLGDISHDIKNLLMPVVCGAGLMHEELKDFSKTLFGAEISRREKVSIAAMKWWRWWRILREGSRIG